ncbi:hypothetical protein ACKI2N_030160 [Cupriavidus sp. 30B13]|uniref:hypothetical protein n=1 Tax=Cupriavidus sp. 30B13 TaxID=3384241 RepID=UPI003B90CC41
MEQSDIERLVGKVVVLGAKGVWGLFVIVATIVFWSAVFVGVKAYLDGRERQEGDIATASLKAGTMVLSTHGAKDSSHCPGDQLGARILGNDTVLLRGCTEGKLAEDQGFIVVHWQDGKTLRYDYSDFTLTKVGATWVAKKP